MSAGNCEMCGESTLRCRLDDRHWHLSYARVSAERDAMADKIVGAFGEGTTADMLVGISHDHEQQIASAGAERDAAVKEKLAALAKVKALHQKIADAYRLMKAARDDGCVWPATWHGCGTGQDCNCRPMRELAKAVRAALASEVPPQPTTPATPTDKEKTR